jgi:signal transduction histidine kinase
MQEKIRPLPILYFFGAWIIYLFFFITLKAHGSNFSGILLGGSTLILDAIVVAVSFNLWRISQKPSKAIFGFLAVAFAAIFLADLFYQPLYNFFHLQHAKISIFLISAYNIPYIVFLIFTFLALGNIFPKVKISGKNFSNLFVYIPAAIVIAVLSTIFFLSFQIKLHGFYLNNFYDFIEIVLQLLCFITAIFCLAVTKNKGVFYLSLGFAINIVADLIMNVDMFSQYFNVGSVVEANCFLSLMLWIYGLVYLKRTYTYKLRPVDWIHLNDSIRSQTVFWNLIFCFVSVALSFIVSYFLLPHDSFSLNEHFLQLFSVIFVVSTVLWVTVSNIFCRRLYKPLQHLEYLTNCFLENIEPCGAFDDHLQNFVEFKRYEESLRKAFHVLNDKQIAERELYQLAVQTAHDIRSPVVALQVVTEDFQEVTEHSKKIIRDATARINDIANNLLTKYKNEHKEEQITVAVMLPLIVNILEEKKLQFRNRQIEWQLMAKEGVEDSCCRINVQKFKCMLSNLVNNAAEAIYGAGSISINVLMNGEYLRIDIIDTGCGIPDEIIAKIGAAGFSYGKEVGLGLGVAAAINYIKDWNGFYNIKSQIGEGTTFVIELPIVNL